MTKKDYQAIAGRLCAVKPDHDGPSDRIADEQWRTDVDAIASAFSADSARFDRARFIEACETGKCKGMGSVAVTAPELPICVKAMGCYCAGHARGTQAVGEECDTRE